MNIYKVFEHGDTKVTIFQDEAAEHPFDPPNETWCNLACWSENEIFGSFLPSDESDCITTEEDFHEWRRNHPDGIICYVRWWGRCGSDMAMLEIVEDGEPNDGAIFTTTGTLNDIKAELNMLNAYLCGAIYAYTIETKNPLTSEQYQGLVELFKRANNFKMDYAPTMERVAEVLKLDDWTVVESAGGHYHNLDKDNGDKEMFRAMFGDMSVSKDMSTIYEMMMEDEQYE